MIIPVSIEEGNAQNSCYFIFYRYPKFVECLIKTLQKCFYTVSHKTNVYNFNILHAHFLLSNSNYENNIK